MAKSKNDKPMISIIVPIYNAEKTLDRCLESLCQQSFSDIEIICVNDGSTDNSDKILLSWSAKDQRIITVNQENHGRGSARNAGLQKARGQYLMFCDSDDYVERDWCARLYDTIEREQVDLVCSQTNIHYFGDEDYWFELQDYHQLKFFGNCFIDDNIIRYTDVMLMNKIFRRTLIEKYHLRFPEVHFEDYFFVKFYLCVIKKTYFLPEKLYHYLLNEKSISLQTHAGSTTAIDHISVMSIFLAMLKKNNLYTQFTHLFWQEYVQMYETAKRLAPNKYQKELSIVVKHFLCAHQKDLKTLEVASDLQKTLNRIEREQKPLARWRYQLTRYLKTFVLHHSAVARQYKKVLAALARVENNVTLLESQLSSKSDEKVYEKS